MAVKDHKVLLVGCGFVGKRHAQCLRDIGVTQFVFYDADPARSRELAEIYGGTTVAKYEDGLKTDADCVYILSPTRLHVQQAILAVKAGKHVFLEQPLSDSLEGIHKLADLAKEKDVVVEIGFCFRFHEGIRQLKQRLDADEIGKVVSIRAMVGEHFPDVRPEDLSADYMKDIGAFELTHDLDLTLYLAGEEPDACYGCYGSHSELGFDSPGTAEMLIRFPQCVANVHFDFFQACRTRTMTVLGQQGQMILNFSSWDEYELRIYTHQTGQWNVITGKTQCNDMFRAESLNFFGAVEGTDENLCPIHEAVKSLIVCKTIDSDEANG